MIPRVGLFMNEFKDGSRHWYYDGVRRRDDGPAVVNPSGNNFWHLNTRQYSEEEYNLLMFMKCGIL